MHVDFDETAVSVDDIINAVVSGGYGASVAGKKQDKKDNKIDNEISNMKFRLIVSLVCLVPLMYISMGHMWGWPFLSVFHGAENGITFALTQMLLTLPIMYVNRKYYITGFKTLFHGAPNMDSLIAIGSGAAFAYGIIAIYCIGYGLGHGDKEFAHSYMMNLYFESAAMILALITLGKFLESRAKGKTSQAIEKLIDLSPKTAVVIRDGKEVTVGVDAVSYTHLNIINQKVAAATGLSQNSPINTPYLILFNKCPVPIAYMEIGFYDSSDLSILQSSSDEIGKAIAEGVDEYLKNN